jgi:hypothetical protein
MKRVTSIATACVAALLLTIGASVGAQDFNTLEKTFLTFSNSVELPGMTLPAGTYTFRLADTPSRNVVQVLSQDEKEVKGQFLFVQAERPEVTGETVITFRETREGATPAVQFWYYPGEKIGKEFIYPKDQAMTIAARTGSTVMSEDGPVSANSTATATNSQGQVTELKREQPAAAAADATVAGAAAPEQAPAAEPAPAVTADASRNTSANTSAGASTNARDNANDNVAVGTSGVQDTRVESTQARAELPRTASPLALTGLLGLLSLAGAIGLRSFRG